jgi:hypothetical protein
MHHRFSFRRFALALVCLTATTLALPAATLPGTQIPAGSTAALGKAPTAASTSTPQGKILQSALSHETRKTLQEAMNSVDVSQPVR